MATLIATCPFCNTANEFVSCPDCGHGDFSLAFEVGIKGMYVSNFQCKKCATIYYTLNGISCCNCGKIINADFWKRKAPCFIATAVYGDYNAVEVLVLRNFRDSVLNRYFLGRLFTRLYYLVGSYFVPIVIKVKVIRLSVKYILDKFVYYLRNK
jgi:hypothetical protein